ncbi:hypothetical protein ABBQ38_004902 [Trebouxia sp. C0009 RCD-2024]
MALSMTTIASSQANLRVQTVARAGTQPTAALTPRNSLLGSRLYTSKAFGRSRQEKRQVLMRAEESKNPLDSVKKAAKDFGDEIKDNAEGTAEKVEEGYKHAKPDNEKPPTEQYRSTELKNSKEKYTPKSDPKK